MVVRTAGSHLGQRCMKGEKVSTLLDKGGRGPWARQHTLPPEQLETALDRAEWLPECQGRSEWCSDSSWQPTWCIQMD